MAAPTKYAPMDRVRIVGEPRGHSLAACIGLIGTVVRSVGPGRDGRETYIVAMPYPERRSGQTEFYFAEHELEHVEEPDVATKTKTKTKPMPPTLKKGDRVKIIAAAKTFGGKTQEELIGQIGTLYHIDPRTERYFVSGLTYHGTENQQFYFERDDLEPALREWAWKIGERVGIAIEGCQHEGAADLHPDHFDGCSGEIVGIDDLDPDDNAHHRYSVRADGAGYEVWLTADEIRSFA